MNRSIQTMKKKHIEWLVYTIIIILQIMVMVYWSRVKVNYFVDELFSMGYACDFFTEEKSYRYIYNSPEFKFGEWFKNSELKSEFILSDNETIMNVPFIVAVNRLLKGRTYFGFMNIAETFLKLGLETTTVILNIILYIIAALGLIFFMKKLTHDKLITVLALGMFGFSCYTISAVEYIRFYILVIMLMFLMLNSLYDLWKTNSLKKAVVLETLTFSFAYFAFRNSELTMAFFGSFMAFFMVAMFLQKKWKLFITNAIFFSLGVLYIALTTNYIKILINPEKYDAGTTVAVKASENIKNASWNMIKYFLSWVRMLFENYYFGNAWIFYSMIIALSICVIFQLKNKEQKKRPYLKVKEVLSDSDNVFILVLLGATIVYTIFCALCGYRGVWRYYCYGFISLTVIFWHIFGRGTKSIDTKKLKLPLMFILSILVIANSVIPFKTRNIVYMFEEERSFVDNVKDCGPIDVVMYLNGFHTSGSLAGHEFYDCVHMMPGESKIFCVEQESYQYEKVDYPETFLLWAELNSDVSYIQEDLKKNGYVIEELGVDRCSRAYLCRLNNL